jgi:hypothetical protein
LAVVHRRALTLQTDDPGPGHRCQSDEDEKYENELALIMSAAVVMSFITAFLVIYLGSFSPRRPR